MHTLCKDANAHEFAYVCVVNRNYKPWPCPHNPPPHTQIPIPDNVFLHADMVQVALWDLHLIRLEKLAETDIEGLVKLLLLFVAFTDA